MPTPPVVADREPESPSPRPLPFRLRSLLLLGLFVGAVWWSYPRAIAAWKLHDLAGTAADYAGCMAGPTGPALIRSRSADLQKLVRRRLIAAQADDRPFAPCAPFARALSGSVDVERAHRATAWTFAEYGGGGPGRLETLRVTTKSVAQLARQAWPFVRTGYTRLIKPTIKSTEAAHPVDLAKPALGTGLPAYRARYRSVQRTRRGHVLALGSGAHLAFYETRDGGLHWKPAALPSDDLARFAERCVAGDARSFNFGLSDSGDEITVVSLGPDGMPHAVPLTSTERRVFAASCDDRALVVLTLPEQPSEDGAVAAHVCPYRRSCAPLPLPRFPGVGALPKFPMDVARTQGTMILSTTMGGIVRVASSRDEGRTWTPWTVAFDAREAGLPAGTGAPGLLLPLGDRVLLYGGGEAGRAYPVLGSKDLGASWRGE